MTGQDHFVVMCLTGQDLFVVMCLRVSGPNLCETFVTCFILLPYVRCLSHVLRRLLREVCCSRRLLCFAFVYLPAVRCLQYILKRLFSEVVFCHSCARYFLLFSFPFHLYDVCNMLLVTCFEAAHKRGSALVYSLPQQKAGLEVSSYLSRPISAIDGVSTYTRARFQQ